MSIKYKQYPPTLAATMRRVVQKRAEIKTALDILALEIPADKVAGPPFCIFNFITSVKEGYDVTLGFPITHVIETGNLKPQLLPEMEVLSIIHRDSLEKLDETVGAVFAYAKQYALISDEFYREVYLGEADPDGPGTEVHFIVHNWNHKLTAGLERVLGPEACETIMQGSEKLEIESGVDDRFEWVKGMLERLGEVADEHQKSDIVSGCAHVFPQSQIDKLTVVFREAKFRTGDPLQAVDAVITFMEEDPGWAGGGVRNGHTVYTGKKPRDPKAYAEAKTDLERRQAYCFCPLVRTKMDQNMPVDFCYCGSGWFRQQWEGATGKPVTIEIVKSVLRGDEKCEFAIHLPEDL